jgi:hypothetical protein
MGKPCRHDDAVSQGQEFERAASEGSAINTDKALPPAILFKNSGHDFVFTAINVNAACGRQAVEDVGCPLGYGTLLIRKGKVPEFKCGERSLVMQDGSCATPVFGADLGQGCSTGGNTNKALRINLSLLQDTGEPVTPVIISGQSAKRGRPAHAGQQSQCSGNRTTWLKENGVCLDFFVRGGVSRDDGELVNDNRAEADNIISLGIVCAASSGYGAHRANCPLS